MSGYGSRVVILLLAALLPVIVLATVWVSDVSRHERERLDAAAAAHVDDIIGRLDREIAGHTRTLEVLAASPLIDAGEMERLRTHFARAKGVQPLWRNLILANREGRQVVNLSFPNSSVRVAAFESFRRVLQTGKPNLTPIVPGPASGYVSIGIRVPVRRNGSLDHVLTAVLDLAAVARSLQEAVPPEWRALVMDRQGRIVVRSSDGTALTGQRAAESAREAVAAGSESVLRRGASLAGVEYMAMYKKSAVTGWTVHVGFPRASLSSLQRDAVQLALAGAVAAVLVAALLSFLLLRELQTRRRQQAALLENQHLEAIGQITGGVAHDFNNLLMIVQAAATALKRRQRDPAQVLKYAETLIAAVQRGAALTGQLLGYARKGRHLPTAFTLGDRSPALLTLLQQAATENVVVTLSIPDEIWPVYADPSAFEIALVNLAANARDAMTMGGRLAVSAANVRLRPHDDGAGLQGDYVAISVSDTGCGIPEKHLHRVFEPFFTTKERSQGTGLGLSQVYGFAKQSGGAVTIKSAVSQGTTVTLYLPRSPEPASPEAPSDETKQPAASGRLLLVEDNAEVALATQRMLESLGFTVSTAFDAADALALLAREPFDFVLSDIVLGGAQSGLDLHAQLARRYPDLPVVLMTGYSETLISVRERGRYVLRKPFDERELMAALNAARSASMRAASVPEQS